MKARQLGPGGRNVAAVAACLACVSGFGFYSLTIYAAYLARAFPLGIVSAGAAAFLLTAGIAGTLVSRLLSRHDVRQIMMCGSLLMAAGLLILGRASTEPVLFLAYVLLGLGQAGLGVVPGLSLVTSWFSPPRRSTAMTMAVTGWSLGGVLVAPAITLGLAHASFRTVSTCAAAVLLAVCCACTALITPFPGGRGKTAPTTHGMLRAAATRTRQFWQITTAQLFIAMAQVGALTHLFAVVASRQDSGFAGRAVSMVAAGSLLGRWLGNALLRRIDCARFYRLLMLVQSCVLVLLAFEHSRGLLLVTSAVLGFTIGNNMVLHPLRLSELFGPRDYARILSLSTLVATAGAAAGPLALGLLRERAHGWTLPYLVAASISLTAAAIASLPARGQPQQTNSPERPLPALRRRRDVGSWPAAH